MGWGDSAGTALQEGPGTSGVPWGPQSPPGQTGGIWPGDGAGAAKLQEILCRLRPKWPLEGPWIMFFWVPSMISPYSYGDATSILGAHFHFVEKGALPSHPSP